LSEVSCDRSLVKQALANLILNAVKYTRKREVAEIEIGQIAIEGENVIFIRDNGAGFDMKSADKLFGAFQRFHRHKEFEGTGVGLATVRRIIQRHGGRIWADAEVDKGATFYFTLSPSIARPAAVLVETGN
jgi:light-regulated signal transduction histidine kinase (bacteriophytochrome)